MASLARWVIVFPCIPRPPPHESEHAAKRRKEATVPNIPECPARNAKGSDLETRIAPASVIRAADAPKASSFF
jgi:hypothetical protein